MSSRFGLVLLSIILVALVVPNARALYEGVFFYLRYIVSPSPVHPLNPAGRYASVFDLVRLRNSARRDYISSRLAYPNATLTQIPIPDSPISNLFLTFNPHGPYTIFSAHYDKLHDDENYQGASDNTAAVSVLLASADELARRDYRGSTAFLFTGEEETGLRGATAFVEFVRARNIALREIVNFDNLGRGRLAIRPSVEIPGWSFTIPRYGNVTYDGRQWRTSPPYSLANARLMRALQVRSDMTVFEHFTARSDSNVFQANGIETVAVSGDDMHFLEQTWHTYADRVERLDESNLDAAFELIVGYAQ